MNRKKTLILLGAVAAVLLIVLLLNLFPLAPEPTPEAVIREFFTAVNARDTQKVSQLLVPGADQSFRWPANNLGKAIHENLNVLSVENVLGSGDSEFTADVTLETLSVRQVMSRATLLWMISQQETDGSEDQALAEIYNKILSEKSLPKEVVFCIIKLRQEGNKLRILPDEALESVLDGNLTENLQYIENLMNGK